MRVALSTIGVSANPLVYVAATLAGIAAGVAANILADRVAGDEDPPWSARHCRKCGAALPASRLVPLVNVRATARSCATCGKPASLRGPLIPLVLAVIYPLLLAHLLTLPAPTRIAPAAIFAVDAVGCAVLAFVFAVDLEHHIVLGASVFPAIAGLIAVALLFDHKALAGMLFGAIICGGLFALLYGLGFVLYRTEALGLGDVYLALLVGVLVGWQGVMTAILVAALLASAVAILLMGLGTAGRRSFIAYGTAMAAGAVAALLFAAPLW